MKNSMNYPIIRMNNESIVIMPGSRFTKNELKSRLHEMDIDSSNIQDKNTLVNLYESTLNNNYNKLKILNKLRKDTEIYNSKLGISQRQSIQASNANTMSNNSKTKIINISTDVKPFNSSNTIQQDINIKSINSNINKSGNLYDKTYISSNNPVQDSNNTGQFGYSENQIENSYNSNNYNYRGSRNFQNSSNQNNIQSNNQSILNNSNKYNNINSSNNNNYSYYTNASQISFQNNNDSLMNSTNNNNYNMNNRNNKSYNQQYQEEINTDINRTNNNNLNNIIKYNRNIEDSSGNNNKIFTNVRTPDQNPQNYQNNNNQSIFSSMINNKSSSNNYDNSRNSYNPYNNNNNSNNNYNSSYNTSNSNNNNLINQNQNNYSRRVIIEEQNQPSPILSNEEEIANNRNSNRYANDVNRNANYVNRNLREPDEESNYSIFSTFRDFKNSPLYKNRKQICFNMLLSFIILTLVIGGFYLLASFWDLLTDPKSVVEGIFGFISSLFFGCINNFYITIPMIILIFVMIIIIKHYIFKKQCKEIFRKIMDDLADKSNRNTGNNVISEDDIYKRYVQNLGVKIEVFKKKYLPVLRKMRRNEQRLKTYYDTVNGAQIIFWEYNN